MSQLNNEEIKLINQRIDFKKSNAHKDGINIKRQNIHASEMKRMSQDSNKTTDKLMTSSFGGDVNKDDQSGPHKFFFGMQPNSRAYSIISQGYYNNTSESTRKSPKMLN